MAVVWQENVGGVDYQVRSAGNTRRLYTDGVFHSQYNATRPVTGSVWDLLFLPAFFHPVGKLKRVLVLGVGGGAVINQLNAFLSPQEIIGVELNATHLDIARRYFSVDASNVELHQADAVKWLRSYRGPKFDLIIDDLFGEQNGEPCRAVAADESWCRLLKRRLKLDGTLVMNFDTSAARRKCFWFSCAKHERWPAAYAFSTPLYSNSVGVWSGQENATSKRFFQEGLQRFSALDERKASCKLKYKMNSL